MNDKAPTEEPQFDVAISFLSRDLAIAERLRKQLQPGLSCFVYSRNQEDVAGTDGLAKFHKIFRHDSRLNVVLFRNGWGETPWTGVEEKAIEASALHSRFRTLFVIQLEKEAKLPEWIPEVMINLPLSDFGITEAVGAIRKRALELHAKIHSESPLEMAKRLDQERSEGLQRKSREMSQEGMDAAKKGAEGTIDIVVTLMREIVGTLSKPMPLEMQNVANGEGEIRLGWTRLHFFWDPNAISSVDVSTLRVSCWVAEIAGPHRRDWVEKLDVTYQARLSKLDEWIWRGRGHEWSPQALAEYWVKIAVQYEMKPPPQKKRRMIRTSSILERDF
jgi:hypothetical protein